MLVDVLVLVVLVDGHPHAADLGQHHVAHPGLHQQVDAGDRVGAEQQLVQLGRHPLGGDPAQLRGHLARSPSAPAGATVKPSCETNRAARSIRSGSSPKDTSGAAGVSSTPARSAAKPPSGSTNSPAPVGCDAHRHRVHGEVAAHQIVVERVAETHLRIARHPVVAVGAERGDLQAVPVLADADGAELDAGVPQRVGPRPQRLLHLLGARVGGEVQVGAQPAQQRVAHRAADQVQLVARGGEQRAELAQHLGVPVQRDRGRGQQLGIAGQVRHVGEPSRRIGHGR